MKKKLTRDSFSTLRETTIVLDKEEQRAVKGGDYLDEHGQYTTDSNGNVTWTRTDGTGSGYSIGSGPGTGSGSGNGTGSGSGYGTGSGPGYGTGSGPGYGASSGPTYTLSEYFKWKGPWKGGNVEGLGYVPADINVVGVEGGTSTTTYGNSSSYTSYYSSSGDYSRSRNEAWYDCIAGKVIDCIPIIGPATSIGRDVLDRKINDAIGGLLDKGHTGAITVTTTYGSPNSTTDMSIRIKIYDAGNRLLYDSY